MNRSLLFVALLVTACGGSASDPASSPDASCAQQACPALAPWNPVQCKCVEPSVVIHASDYDQSCTKDSDCVPFFDGDICPCACPNAAISKQDEARARADEQRAAERCTVKVACGACASDAVQCTNNQCAIVTCNGNPCPPTPQNDAGADAH